MTPSAHWLPKYLLACFASLLHPSCSKSRSPSDSSSFREFGDHLAFGKHIGFQPLALQGPSKGVAEPFCNAIRLSRTIILDGVTFAAGESVEGFQEILHISTYIYICVCVFVKCIYIYIYIYYCTYIYIYSPIGIDNHQLGLVERNVDGSLILSP